jgi:hypothetical protein
MDLWSRLKHAFRPTKEEKRVLGIKIHTEDEKRRILAGIENQEVILRLQFYFKGKEEALDTLYQLLNPLKATMTKGELLASLNVSLTSMRTNIRKIQNILKSPNLEILSKNLTAVINGIPRHRSPVALELERFLKKLNKYDKGEEALLASGIK